MISEKKISDLRGKNGMQPKIHNVKNYKDNILKKIIQTKWPCEGANPITYKTKFIAFVNPSIVRSLIKDKIYIQYLKCCFLSSFLKILLCGFFLMDGSVFFKLSSHIAES